MSEKAVQYYTIAAKGEGIYKEKGSKFLSFAYPIEDEEEIKNRLEELRKAYHDARHYCYAFMLGAERTHFRTNDDGEPNHSAGDPILGRINAQNLTNILIVVVRYFGGTKLGVGGLITAYKVAAEGALIDTKIIKVDVTQKVTLRYKYEATNEVMRLVTDYNIDIVDQSFEADCQLIGKVKIDQLSQIWDKIQLLKATGCQVDVKIN